MELTNTTGSRDWLASSENLDFNLTIPKNFLHHDVIEIIIPNVSSREVYERTKLELDLAAYISAVECSAQDLDPELEAAGIATWLDSGNQPRASSSS